MDKDMYNTELGKNGFVIKAFIITMINNNTSVVAARNLLQTIEDTRSRIQPFMMQATIPSTIQLDIKNNFPKDFMDSVWNKGTGLRWTWPINPTQDGMDLSTGLYKKAYRSADLRKVMACSISHMRLWQHCIDIDQPIMVLEHDAKFSRRFDYKNIIMCGTPVECVDTGIVVENIDGVGKAIPVPGSDRYITTNANVHSDADEKYRASPQFDDPAEYTGQFTGGIMGLNSPIGATRKAHIFDQKVRQPKLDGSPGKLGISTVPYVDDPGDLPLPSGLAGNSAYIIKPWAAKKLLEKVKEVGIWPNDALMCRQFFPWLQVYYPYFTAVQRTTSTTTL